MVGLLQDANGVQAEQRAGQRIPNPMRRRQACCGNVNIRYCAWIVTNATVRRLRPERMFHKPSQVESYCRCQER